VWLGGDVLESDGALVLHGIDGATRITGRRAVLDWLAEVVTATRPKAPAVSLEAIERAFPGDWERFAGTWRRVRGAGLVIV
jgi:hypothetical protein